MIDYDKIVNQRIAAVPPSGIRVFFDIVADMPEAISLGVGEPDFVTPWNIRNAAIESIQDGMTQYTSNKGRIQLRKLICEYLKFRYNVSYDPEHEVLVTVGASEGIDLSLRALLEPGDEVLIPEPSYVSYAPGVVFAGGNPVGLQTSADNGFKLTADELKKRITPRTKAVILPYPNNPTGGVMTREDFEAIADVLKDTDIIVISDEIYSELVYNGHEHVSFADIPGMHERTILLNGFSKAFAMTGWRIGYMCAPRKLLDLMVKIHQFTILCAPMQGQIAAEAAIRSGFENNFADVDHMVRSYDRRRRLMVSGFNSMGLECFEPLGAFYVFPSIKSTGMNSNDFCQGLLKAEKVACVPGTAFGACGEGYIRCSYATSVAKLTEALKRIARYVEQLK